MIAELIFIGTELLFGQIANSNSPYISKKLQSLGIECYHQSIVGDNLHRLAAAFNQALERSDILITTGGLGPTADDLTKEASALFLKKDLILNQDALSWIKERFRNLQKPMMENNLRQAYFTKDSILLKNNNGTAPGVMIPLKNEKYIFHLPGPPIEMRPMFEQYLIPFLKTNNANVFKNYYIRTTGIGESELEHKIKSHVTSKNPSLALYSSLGEVVLRLTAFAPSETQAEKLLSPSLSQIKKELNEYIYRIDNHDEGNLQDTVINALQKKNKTIAIAESLTGGMLSSALVDIPGSSSVFSGSVVTYTEDFKSSLLMLDKKSLKINGAVSKYCAEQMAISIKKLAKTDIGLALTGVAGPGKDKDGNPAGLVFIALADKNNVFSYKYNFIGDRQRIRHLSTITALNLLRLHLQTF